MCYGIPESKTSSQTIVKRLPVFRSSSFRIIALFAGCFLVSGLLVTGLSGYRGQKILSQQIRQAVANERDEAFSEAHGRDVSHLYPVIKELVQNEPGFYYLLQDDQEHSIISNMLHLRPIAGWRWLAWTHRTSPSDRHPVIGYGTVLYDGGYFFVGIDSTALQSLHHDLWLTLSWSSIVFLLIGLGGGIILSRLILGKIETISLTAREIMHGDITRRITLSATGDEFDHLADSLNAMLDRNEALIASVRQVSDDIAHDMRRPLARLGQYLDEAMGASVIDIRNGALLRAKAGLRDALEIFSSLLRLAQIESRDRVPDSQVCSVQRLLEKIESFYKSVAEDYGHTLIIITPESDLMIDGNRVLLVQMLSNLIENAINHSPAGARIVLSAELQNAEIMFVVTDTGPGIPPAERERVFEKMVRLDSSRTIPGNGLGLSMVRAIVCLHRGIIRLQDNKPGLRCEITLPVFSVSEK
ncbi:ATP-binding protein [Acetobacter pasteurianus]